jgi:hypothetical protein
VREGWGTRPSKWEEKTLLISTVIAAVAGVLALLGVQELHPWFEFFKHPVQLWAVLIAIVIAASAPGIVRKRTPQPAPTQGDERVLRDRCKLTIETSSRATESGSSNRYLLSGKFDVWPFGKRVWLVLGAKGIEKYWPQAEVSPSPAKNTWDGIVHLGPKTRANEEMKAILLMVGEVGHATLEYYFKVEDKDAKERGKKLALSKLPDAIHCDERTLLKVD